MRTSRFFPFYFAPALFAAALASAQEIRAPASVTTDMGENVNGPLAGLTNQGGLSTTYASGVDAFDTYIGGGPTHVGMGALGVSNDWISFPAATGVVDFDLGAPFAVDRIAVWNATDSPTSAVNTLRVFGASDPSFNPAVLFGDFTLPMPTGFSTPADILMLTNGGGTFRYFRFQITANHGGGVSSLGEVAFRTPEPTAALAASASLAVLVCLVNRRRDDSQ